ncbi:hypothetical protein E3N86_12350 [Cryobacterium sp. Hz7]|uniref:hypothetical protein n=1 Tax=Cryobacterium sp. Hz7 TaxID=1259166 RepID=UPI00106D8751|nr:hypothetical protein [Cryobacterium sp. Hz7]TFB59026.1 hypothetical protein E3N86_12350 [Cryobacterium sp. Hz7]
MTSSNHTRDRALQQDARAWQAFTGQSYTAALRQIEAPYARGTSRDELSRLARATARIIETATNA